MKKWQKFFAFLGRILISMLFILSAIHKIVKWQENENLLTGVLQDWQSYLISSQVIQNFLSVALDWIPLFLLLLIIFELIGGLLVFFNINAKLGSFLLILYLIITNILFHHFWNMEGDKREIEIMLFLKNMAIMGGVLFVWAFSGNLREKPVSQSPNMGHASSKDSNDKLKSLNSFSQGDKNNQFKGPMNN